MTPVGQPDRASGPIDVRAVLTTAILGAFTAASAAVPIWLWEISPIPALVILSSHFQGLLIAAAIRFMVGRLEMRTPRLVTAMAFACGVGSVLMVHYGHYLYSVRSETAELRESVNDDPRLTSDQKRVFAAHIDADPLPMVNGSFTAKTVRGGFFGHMILRNQAGVRIKGKPTTGIILWALWCGEALLAAVFAAAGAKRASEPFCEDCQHWCHKEPDLFNLPAAAVEPLADAVSEDDAPRIAALRLRAPDGPAPGRLVGTLHACPGCDQAFADLSHLVTNRNRTSTTAILRHLRVSPEIADVFRTELVGEPEPESARGPQSRQSS